MIVGNAKTKGAKPSTVGMVCHFFRAGALESIGDSVISLMVTKVRGAKGILHRCSRKYSSQSSFDLTNIVLSLIPACVLGRRHKLAAIQLFFHMTSLLIQMIPRSAKF